MSRPPHPDPGYTTLRRFSGMFAVICALIGVQDESNMQWMVWLAAVLFCIAMLFLFLYQQAGK